MFGFRKGIARGIPTKDGKLYCPLHDKVVSSEDELSPRGYRNQRLGRGFGFGRGRGIGRGMGRRCRFW